MKHSRNIQLIRRKAAPVFRRYGVKKASVFGSFARGEERKTSDVDMLVRLRPIGLLRFVSLKRALEEQLGRRVDLVTEDSIHPFLKKKVLEEKISIYEEKKVA